MIPMKTKRGYCQVMLTEVFAALTRGAQPLYVLLYIFISNQQRNILENKSINLGDLLILLTFNFFYIIFRNRAKRGLSIRSSIIHSLFLLLYVNFLTIFSLKIFEFYTFFFKKLITHLYTSNHYRCYKNFFLNIYKYIIHLKIIAPFTWKYLQIFRQDKILHGSIICRTKV